MFDQKGQIIVDKEECELDADDLMMQALDAGAEDFSEEEDSFEILTDPNDFSEVRLALEEAGIPMASAEVTMIPQTWVTLDNEEDIKNIQKTLDLLEDDDDVQEVYHNWNQPERKTRTDYVFRLKLNRTKKAPPLGEPRLCFFYDLKV